MFGRTAFIATLLVLGACRSTGDPGTDEAAETVATTASTTLTTSTTSSTTASTATSSSTSTTTTSTDAGDETSAEEPVNEAEADLQFDIGAIVGTTIADGATWLQFDRYQMYGSGDNGTDLTAEPMAATATDVVVVNENNRLRWYRVAADAEVLELQPDWIELACDSEPVDVEWIDSSLDQLLRLDARLVSLTFDDGEVTRIRDQRNC